MKRQLSLSQTPSARSQRGIATILIVVLIGVALTATAMGIMHSMRSTQEKHVAVHAATNAQVGAWAGVEAFRRYLETLDSATLDTGLPEEIPLAIGTGGESYGSMTVKDVLVTNAGDSYRVNATIINTLDAAHASAAIGVVYEVGKVGDCPGCVKLTAALDFHDDLEVEGDIEFILPEHFKPNINVDGNVRIKHTNLTSLGVLTATGAVDLDSGVHVEEIYSNDDVSLTGSARADKVTTLGSVTTGGNGGASIIWANGSLTLDGSYPTSAGNTRSTIHIKPGAGYQGPMIAQGNVTLDRPTQDIQTKSNVIINYEYSDPSTPVKNIIAEGDLLCPVGSLVNFNNVSVNGSIGTGCTAVRDAIGTKATEGAANSVSVMTELQPFTVPRLVIDVWTLENYANYIFRWNTEENRPQVVVNNIKGIASGTSYWMSHSASSCAKLDITKADDDCSSVTDKINLCVGEDSWCFSYKESTKTWVVEHSNKSILPGILWFEGNVDIANNTSYSTVLATGDITLSSGGVHLYSVNYAGYDIMCEANADISGYNSHYRNQIPENLCNTSEQKYLPLDVGNIGLAAGGYNPADNGDYSGGNITLESTNHIYGSVLAGNYLRTRGHTNVYGFVSAAVQGGQQADKNLLGAKTTMDLTRGNEHYNPNIIPDMTDGACPDCEDLGNAETGGAKVLWSKYR